MKSSYKKEDVTLLLKDITGLVKPQSTKEREQLIQLGKHYCEMLPIEYSPSSKYMEVYKEALKNYAEPTAVAIGCLADRIWESRRDHVVLVSLARAGTPIGILLKRYFAWKYSVCIPHYSISIIRGRGIDKNAIRYLLNRYRAEDLLFVDGWIGKGAILRELKKNVEEFKGLSPDLAVVADPANLTELCGTHQDILIPSSCLNCTISGLISRTFLRDDIIGKDDFHGAAYYGELAEKDLTYQFIDQIQIHFKLKNNMSEPSILGNGMEEVNALSKKLSIEDINFIKPGIGETTRVLLRRVPWKVLIRDTCRNDVALKHILRLAEEKHVPVEYLPLTHYKACGIIKKLADA